MIMAVGLGNPGKKYEQSRHNLGFQVVDKLAQRFGVGGWENRSDSLVSFGRHKERRFMLVKPQTFMNNSGRAVQPLLHYYRIPLEGLLVVVDDLDLDVGRIRLRSQGSDGGHKGLRSIIESLGSREFKRIRIGIGRPEAGESVVGRVLRKVDSPAEAEALSGALEQAAGIAADFIVTDTFENWTSP